MTTIRDSRPTSPSSATQRSEGQTPPPQPPTLTGAPVPTLDEAARRAPLLEPDRLDKPRLGGAAPADPGAVKGRIEERLHALYLTDGAEDAILTDLEKLSPQGFREVVGGLEEGKLGRFLGSIASEQRHRFLGAALKAGYVKPRPCAPVPEGARFSPPESPRLLLNDPKLPKPLREAIHEENVDVAKQYSEAYSAYHERRRDAAYACQSGAELRALGPAVLPDIPNCEPGTIGNDELATKWTWEWMGKGGFRDAADWDRLNSRVNAFSVAKITGDPIRGALDVSVEGKAVLKGNKWAGGVELEGKLNADGTHSGTIAPVASRSSEVAKQGFAADAVVVSVGIKADPRSEVVTFSGEVGGAPAGASVEVSTDGKVKVGANLVGAQGAISSDGTVEIGAGKVFEGELGGVGYEIGAEVKGEFNPFTDQERIERAFTLGEGVFGTPKELSRGVAWDRLPPDRQRDLQSLAWTKDEWEGKRSLARQAGPRFVR